MSAKYFLDTNVLVYSFEQGQPEKRARAMALIANALQTGEGVISTQVVQEFLNVATRKFASPLTTADCKMYLHKVLHPLCQVYPDEALYESALDISHETGYSFYDSLIIAGSLRAGCAILYSEDLQPGQQIRSVQVVKPFAT